jgi:hypothetical protein
VIRKFMGGSQTSSRGLSTSTADIHFIANRLRRYFAPASVFPAPKSSRTATGNRNTTISANNAANTGPSESALVQLNQDTGTAALAQYNFKNKYKNPPIVTVTAVGANPNGPQELTLQGLIPRANNGVAIQSSDHTDTRFVHITVQGNPD